MALVKLLSNNRENKEKKEIELKNKYKQINKQSNKVVDLIKRIEAIEEILGLN